MAPTFTPDGRLLQVEYASTASELSAPIFAVQADEDTLILVTTKHSNTPQNRLIILPVRGDGKEQVAPSICVAMSGVLADSISLIQVALKEASEQHRLFRSPMSPLQLATTVANACQSHSFGGGIRPFGSTLLTCGFSGAGTLCMYQTDPSGAIVDAITAVADTDTTTSSKIIRWVVGGNPTAQRKLQKRIEASLSKAKRSSSLSNMVSLVAKTLLQETRKQQKETKVGDFTQGSISIEAVIVHRRLGCYRLSNKQINAILK